MTVASESLRKSYLERRQRSIEANGFPLEALDNQTVSTARAVKPLLGWEGFWPVIRELVQNTSDHLELIIDGRRNPALSANVFKEHESGVFKFEFACGIEPVCAFIVGPDKLSIEQHFTYPLHPRALESGISDEIKMHSQEKAGGFGDGFKSAAQSFLAMTAADPTLKFTFEAQGRLIVWDFLSVSHAAVSVYRSSATLSVDIKVSPPNMYKENWMRQDLRAKNIGRCFLCEALPRLQVFWTMDESALIGRPGRNFLSQVQKQGIVGLQEIGALASSDGIQIPKNPQAGIYIQGIWVQRSKLPQVILSFYDGLKVAGRDRNHVDAEQLLEQVVSILRVAVLHGNEGERLANLLASLLTPASARSWLTRKPCMKFLNVLLSAHRSFFLQDVFGMPRYALFLRRNCSVQTDPFLSWACNFLADRATPIIPVHPCTNRYLFQDSNEDEIAERCSVLLRQEAVHNPNLNMALQLMFDFLADSADIKVFFCNSRSICFMQARSIFVPAEHVSKRLLLQVLNAVIRSSPYHNDKFAHLMQGLCESLHTSVLTTSDVESAIRSARRIESEACGPSGVGKTSNNIASRTCLSRATPSPDFAICPAVLGREVSTQIEKCVALAHRNGNIIRKRGCRSHASDCLEEGDCMQQSKLYGIQCSSQLGSGKIFCDSSRPPWATWTRINIERLRALRKLFQYVVLFVSRAMPQLTDVMKLLREGYAAKGSFRGFCTSKHIVINFHAFLPRINLRGAEEGYDLISGNPLLFHELLTTLVHELSHALERGAHHGPSWRNMHAQLLSAICAQPVAEAARFQLSEKPSLGKHQIKTKRHRSAANKRGSHTELEVCSSHKRKRKRHS